MSAPGRPKRELLPLGGGAQRQGGTLMGGFDFTVITATGSISPRACATRSR